MIFIQRKDIQFKTLETVDEATTLKEAKYLLANYRLSDKTAQFYTSQRPCKNWR